MTGYHFFVERNGGEWHRTETQGEPGGEPVRCACGISNQDSRVLKHRDSDDDSWQWVPESQLGRCFPEHMRNPPELKPRTGLIDDPMKRRQAIPRLHVDATLAAANRMTELQAENEQLRSKLAEHELLFSVAISTDDFLHNLLVGLGHQLPPGTPRTADGIVDAVATMALKLDAHEDASTPAFDEIAKLCGCPQWEYPGQVIRDVERVVKERDELRERLRVAEAVRDDARAASNRDLERRRVAEAEVAELRERLEAERPARSVKELVAEAVVLRDRIRNMDEASNRIEECECSPKYRELAPGVHAGYCPLKGLPLAP